jgi:hypothetical protein
MSRGISGPQNRLYHINPYKYPYSVGIFHEILALKI